MTEKRKSYQEKHLLKSEGTKGLPSYWVHVTRTTPKNPKGPRYSKLVSREKAMDLIYGRVNEMGQRKNTRKHKYQQVEKSQR